MNLQHIVKEAFEVIGKEGTGDSTQGYLWVPPLWKEANDKFDEISGLVKLKEDGRIAGVWGAMSDINYGFRPWDIRGKYLAGCEVTEGAAAPEGWVKWSVPSFRYVTAECNSLEYGKVFQYVLKEYFIEYGLTLAGAVHEYYPEPGNTEKLCLYFPIEKL